MRWTTALGLILAITCLSTSVEADEEGRTIWGDDYRSTLRAMKKVQRSLGVKSCLHCHVKQDGKMAYGEETEHKEIARSMYFAFVDTLASTGKAKLTYEDHGQAVTVSAVRKTKGEDAGIHITLMLPPAKEGETPRTLTKRVDLPGKDQPIECGTCHTGTLHFINVE
jgi:hypothetical protein